jgi:alpha-mannosidase
MKRHGNERWWDVWGWFVAIALGGAGMQAQEGRLQEVIIVFKTHFDIGYTEMASNVVKRYRTTMIDQALQVVDENRSLPPEQQFVWTLPGWPMRQIAATWAGQTEDRRERVLRAVREGRFAVHALPFTLHTELFELEDLVRGLEQSSILVRSLGLPLPRDAKMTDVPCHAWIWPTILRHAGVEFLHLGCNAASASPEVPRLFWWQGPDGSKLLTMYTGESYGTGLTPPSDWPHRTWLALIHTGDNHGPPAPQEVAELLQTAHAKLPGVKVRIGRLSDFAAAILAENPVLPVVRGDMPDTWIHGPMSDPAGAKLARNLRPLLSETEILQAQLRAWGVSLPNSSGVIADAFERSLLYGEHTWGGALYWIAQYEPGRGLDYGKTWRAKRSEGNYQRLEDSWAEHTAYIEQARDLLMPLLDRQLSSLASSVETAGRRIVVYNPLPWKRDGLVAVRIPEHLVAVRLADGRKPAPVDWNSGEAKFLARNIPPFGFRTYVPCELSQSETKSGLLASDGILENSYFRLMLDVQRGTIKSLWDKHARRELVEQGAPHGFGQYLHEQFSANEVDAFVKAYVKINAAWATNELGKSSLPPASEVGYRTRTPGPFQATYERTPISVTATLKAASGPEIVHPVTMRVLLYRDQPWVEVELTLEQKPADSWPEAGWLCLPFQMERPRFRLGRQGSIVDPAADIIRGANRHLYALTTGMMIEDERDFAVGICPLDHPLVSLDVPGGWKYSRDFVPRKSRVYLNLFNNQWTTNFRLWNQGTWSTRVRIWTATDADPGRALIAPALDARQPLLAAMAEGSGGILPVMERGLELSRRDVQVTAFEPSWDGAGRILRLWELAGRGGKCHVRLPDGWRYVEVQPVDLRGEPNGAAVLVKSGRLTVELHPFAPLSLRLRPIQGAPVDW